VAAFPRTLLESHTPQTIVFIERRSMFDLIKLS
jgi:hypothetical protein